MNLETELIKQNRKLATPTELLQIQQFEKYASLENDTTLEKLGMISQIKQGGQRKIKIETLQKETTKFPKERVFHISQVKAICEKYRLRFLPSEFYSGELDKELPLKVSAFEITHGVTLNGKEPRNVWSVFDTMSSIRINLGSIYGLKDTSIEMPVVEPENERQPANAYIMAPKESFKLQARPMDPLLFYKINEDYFYLIHKWGNDLSWTRRAWTIILNLLGKNYESIQWNSKYF